ncbi:MAG: FAD-binding oxidoreductase [Hyphomicrobiaceae bacterium]
MAHLDPSIFTSDCRLEPYWWDRTPRRPRTIAALPEEVDVLIVGAGYTGLNTALVTARAGRSTLVLDAEAAGHGCSSRNGGQISTSVKTPYDTLARRFGPDRAFRIVREGHASLAFIGQLVGDEAIDCDFRISGRFHAAHNQRAFEAQRQWIAAQPKGLEVRADLIDRTEQHRELGTDVYYGGIVYHAHAAVDPARYHQGLLERVEAAGATVASFTPATAIEAEGSARRVTTPHGSVRARDVVIATNGYTGTLTPWLRRRVIPIGSYMIATEPLAPAVMDRLMPAGRVVSDTRKVVYYYRPSPDRSRILFGGRVSCNETDPAKSAPKLRAELIRLFPELSGVRVSHSWCGTVAYTFDEVMHVGRHDGVWYAMGYCGSGVGMASYLGMRLGQQVLGLAEGKTAFDGLSFQTRPLYTGNPWFLAPSLAWYRWKDAH